MPEPFFTFAADVHPICEVGMGETRQAEPTTWVDVSCYVHEAEVFRGRERFTERFEPGTASVTFSNDSGWADLGGTYVQVAAAILRPGRHIRIGVRGEWTPGLAPFTRWLYRGFIDQATPLYDPTLHDVVTINCIDALGEAGQTTAPTGEHQGVNETVSARINRVLDAVGWWGTKRKIDASPTTVQGTELGQAAIDHLGQTADSAGGVVFGDLDGDVVFRDIDWMLYDPDDPPDGTIGPGDPGTPGGDLPPYIDPVEGPVYDPDDPPTTTPPKVCVCADGTAGTLIEKGDNYRLYVRAGHLFYESSGTTWDLGPYEGGCTCVEPPSGGGGGGPVRSDDPDEDGDYEISPFPPIELPPVFGVEFLGYSDGGLADPPAASVTVTGIAPGHDCQLAVLVNALGTATNATGLAPVVDGGGLDWAHRRDADQASDGASSFVVVAPVGRDDPGTFDVVVTWAAGMTSRTHIVTVWKITAALDAWLERFDAGVVPYATTDSNPPDEVEPGDGVQVVDLVTDHHLLDVAEQPRGVDITIAQSLAEEGTEPFGASFDTVGGEWWTPAFAETAPVLLADEWCDEFDRPDIGADWVTGPVYVGQVTSAPIMVAGHIEVAEDDLVDGHRQLSLITAASWPGDQSIDAVFANVYQGKSSVSDGQIAEGEHFLMCRANDTDSEHVLAFVRFLAEGAGGGLTGECFVQLYTVPATGIIGEFDLIGEGSIVGFDVTANPDLAVRFETVGTTARCLFREELVAEGVFSAGIDGDRVGFGMQWHDTEYTPADPDGESFWVESVCVNALGGIVRKCSWVAGWRANAPLPTVVFDDVNFGPSNIQSAQACLVVESAEPESGWRLIGYDIRASITGVTAAGTMTFDNPPRPGALVAVFVGVTASTDVMAAVSVTGADFAVTRAQPKTGSSWGQGAIFTTIASLDLDPTGWAVTVGYPELESISVAVYEVTDQDDEGPLGATASGVLGTGASGSVDGPSTITLSAAGDAAAVVLAYVHVAATPGVGSGVATEDGDEWHEEFQSSSTAQRAYFQTMSRAPGQPESTSASVHWADVQTGTAATFSGVELALEVHPYDGLPPLTGAGSGVALGGVTDAWNGTIGSAGAYNPDGTPVWEFP